MQTHIMLAHIGPLARMAGVWGVLALVALIVCTALILSNGSKDKNG